MILLSVIRLKMSALISCRTLLFGYGMVMDALVLGMMWLWCNLFDDRRCDVVLTLFVEKLREEVELGKGCCGWRWLVYRTLTEGII